MNKQIEEMAKCCTYYHNGECCACTTEISDCDLMCEMFGFMANLEQAGYRKASHVVEEIANFIWEKDIADTLLPINGRYLSKQDLITELKKKFEVTEE